MGISLSPGSHLLLFITWCLMTRLDAYKCMLEGKQVTHPMLPDSLWSLDLARKVRVNGSNLDWSIEFFQMDYLENQWEMYDQS